MKNVQLIVDKVLELVQEVQRYSFYKQNLVRTLDRLFDDYQAGKFTYFEYEKTKKRLLKGKSRDEWISYYNSYILSLLKRIETYNSQIFYETYQDQEYERLKVSAPAPAPAPKPKPAPKPAPKHVLEPSKPVERPAPIPEPHVGKPEQTGPERVVIEKPKPEEAEVHAVEAAPETAHEPASEPAPEKKLVEVKPSVIDRISLFFRHLLARKKVEKAVEEMRKPVTAARPAPVPAHVKDEAKGKEVKRPAVEGEKEPWFAFLWRHKKKTLPLEEPGVPEEEKPRITPKKRWFSFLWKTPKPTLPVGAKKAKAKGEEKERKKEEKKKAGIDFGKIFGWDYINNLLNRSRDVEFTKESSKAPMSTYQLETLRRKAKPEITAQIEKITATSLTKEAKRIKSIMGKRKALKIYQPSFFGSLANIAIRRVSLYLLDEFPDFFKDLYHALRLANIKVLSNTYVNMMVLGVLVSTVLGFFIFGIFFTATALPITQILFRTVMMAFLMGVAAFAGFYAYPYSKMKQRRRSINTNLPFAINHMAAVSSSGVAPVRMFKLISQSKEYGEVSVEIEKIVNYIDVFGYDVLTALKAVAATSPSYGFKDFLEGMVSTTQTGGDLKSYFSQKAEEAMLNYKLERQKYTETISTYSDIYTGILIAAPLFFVAALSLVSLLGGKIGGMDVNVVIVIGTYVIIPFMNVAFLTFLEMTQPEI